MDTSDGITQIVKLCEEFEDITYIDICTYIDNLKQNYYINEIIDQNNLTYTINAIITPNDIFPFIVSKAPAIQTAFP